MTDAPSSGSPLDAPLSRPDAAAAIEGTGWQLLLGAFRAAVPVPTLEDGFTLIQAALRAAGADADAHLRLDLRPDRVEFRVQDAALGTVTRRDVEVASAIATALRPYGRRILPPTDVERPVQSLEVAIDCLTADAIRPFWKAVLGYVDEPVPGSGEIANGIVDPAGQGPAFWFQQMDEPRPQRNRIHLDITVSPDEAEPRVRAALAAGGVLVSDAAARSFWVLADAEGNEICVCTHLDRD